MNRFYDKVGYAHSVEDPVGSGIWVDQIVEYPYFGNITRNTRQLQANDDVNPDVVVSNSISIVGDQYAFEHFFAIRYVRWAGVLWQVTTVDASQSPRLVLSLGSVYNGPTPTTSDTP